MHSSKNNINKIFLSLLALLLLLSVAIGVTYSWIEGGITYTISGNVKTIASKTTTYGAVNATPLNKGTDLDLAKFDYVTNKDLFHFTPVSGDGNNFFFDIGSGQYRQADTNDVGTKFIKYDFDFTPDRNCYLYFTEAPAITLTKGVDFNPDGVDTSDFIFMIKCGDDAKYFSTASVDRKINYIIDTNGTTKEITINPIKNYVFDKDNNDLEGVLSFSENTPSNIEVAIWLDDSVSDNTLAQLSGCEIKFNLKMKLVGEKVTVNVATVVAPSTASIPSGAVTINGSGTAYEGYEGDTVTIKAIDKTGYTFDGWYEDEDCTKSLTSSKSTSITVGGSDTTYYAKYRKNYKVSLIARLGEDESTAGTSTAGGYVSFDSASIDGLSVTANIACGDNVTLNAKAKDGYELVKIVGSDGTEYESGAVIEKISKDMTFYAEFKATPMNTLYFKPSSNWKTDSAWFTGWVWGGSAPDQWIVFEDTDGDGIYSANIPKSSTGIKFYRMSNKVTAPSFDNGVWNQSGDITIDKSGPNLFKAYSDWGFTGGTWHNFPVTVNVEVNNSSYGSAQVDSKTSIVTYSGHSATLTASPASSSYEFVGWYDADGNKVSGTNTSDSQTLTISGDIDEIITYTAKFQKKTATTRTIYFDANHWDVGDATFAAYVWNSSGEKTIWMSEIDNTGVFSCEIDKAYTNIIFIRMNNSATSSSFGWNYKWNQTADLTIPSDGKNMFAPYKDNWDGANGTWSIYTG